MLLATWTRAGLSWTSATTGCGMVGKRLATVTPGAFGSWTDGVALGAVAVAGLVWLGSQILRSPRSRPVYISMAAWGSWLARAA